MQQGPQGGVLQICPAYEETNICRILVIEEVVEIGQQLGEPVDASLTGGGGSGQKSWYEGFSCGAKSDLPFWDGTLLAVRLGRVLRQVVLGFV